MVRQLETDLPELLAFGFPRHLWRKLRTTNICGSTAPYSAHGLLRKGAERGSHHLLHLPALQPGMENPHPPGFYTSSLTSPSDCLICAFGPMVISYSAA